MSVEGKTIVFTGTLSVSRAEIGKLATAAGARVVGSISGKTEILVAGPGAGSKMAQAEAKGMEVWTEEQFMDAIAGGSSSKPAAKKKKAAAGGKKGKRKANKVEEPEEEAEEEAPPKKGKKAPVAPSTPVKPKAKKVKKEEPEAAAAAAATSTETPRRRGASVDRLVPGRKTFSIYEDYSVKLNQTNIDGNNNKYYIINLLEGPGGFYTWNRWGRVGEDGQNKLTKCGSVEAAIAAFEKKFKDKTLNSWANRDSFVKRPGKYQLVETDEAEGEGDGEDGGQALGKLSAAQIEKGQAVLAEIEANLSSSASVLRELSSQYFSLIPTKFGRAVPKPITTIEEVRQKEEMLKFWLRMGFEEIEDAEDVKTPIDGVMDLPLPSSLDNAVVTPVGLLCGKHDVDNCNKRGITLASQLAGSPTLPMDSSLYASILLYTSNAIYRELNKVLRDENRKAIKKYMKYLRLFLEAMATLPQREMTVWRGVSVDLMTQYKVGHTITWWGVSSCTVDEGVARNFANGCGGKSTMLTIHAKTACDISEVTFYSHEKESLLAPGTQLVVRSAKRKGKISEIVLEEVGRAIQ